MHSTVEACFLVGVSVDAWAGLGLAVKDKQVCCHMHSHLFRMQSSVSKGLQAVLTFQPSLGCSPHCSTIMILVSE